MTDVAWLLYDGDCRVCKAFAHAVRALDVRGNISIRPLQEAGALLPGVQGEEILDAMRFVAPDGSVTAAGDGVIALLARLVDGDDLEPLLRRSRLFVRSARRFYAALVELRGHLVCRIPAGDRASSPR